MDMPGDQPGTPEHRQPHAGNGDEVDTPLQQQLQDLQRTNRALRLLSTINQALMHVTTEMDLIRQTCEIAVDIGQYRMAWVGFAEYDAARTVRPICHAGHEDGYLRQGRISWGDNTFGQSPTGTAIRTDQPVTQADLANAPAFAPWREAALTRGYRSSIALPLHIDDQVIGALTLYHDELYSFSPEEMKLLTELSDDLSYGISVLRMRERQRETDDELRQSERRLRELIVAAPYGAHEYELHPDGHLIFIGFNPAANRILGVDHTRFLGMTIEEAFPSLVETPIPEAYRRVVCTGERYEDEQVTYAHGEITGAYEISAFQTGSGRMAVFFRDITERKLVEKQLQESEEQFRILIQRLPLPIAVYSDSGDIKYLNDRFITVLGYTLGDIPHVADWWLRAYPDEDYRREVMELWQQAVEKAERTHTDIEPHDYRVTRKDGAERITEISGTHIGSNNVVIWNDITERVQAEEALREKGFQLEETQRVACIGNYLLNIPTGRWTSSAVLDDIFGINVDYEHTVEGWLDLIHPAEREAMAHYFQEVAIPSKVFKKDYRIIRLQDGAERWVMGLGKIEYDQDGKPLRMFGTIQDITERKLVEEALREREALLRAVVENAPFEFWARDLDGRCIMVNKALVQHWGNLLGQRLEDALLSPEELAIWRENNRRAFAGELVQVEVEYDVTGEKRVFQNIVAPIYIDERLQGIMGINIDITERKRAEEANKRESTFLASAIELLPFPIFIVTPSYEVIRQNRASCALWHTSNTLPLGGVEFLDPQTYAICPVQDWPIIHALQGETMPTRELILRQQDGRELSILLQTAPIFINEELVAAVVAIQDITALKDADRAKNQFLMVLSHEVKTPLTSIIGWAQLAQGTPDVIPEALATIMRNAHMQKALLERLLILSRILTGKLMLTSTATDLWSLALQTLTRFRRTTEERHLTITLDPPEDALVMQAEGKLLEQAICEVIENAINFTPAGGSVTVQGRREHEAIVLAVSDTGQGIAPEQLPTLLTPFTQIQRKEEIGGLGIGLALVRGIVEAHGGRVTLSSAGLGQGTTVTFRFPHSAGETKSHEREKENHHDM